MENLDLRIGLTFADLQSVLIGWAGEDVRVDIAPAGPLPIGEPVAELKGRLKARDDFLNELAGEAPDPDCLTLRLGDCRRITLRRADFRGGEQGVIPSEIGGKDLQVVRVDLGHIVLMLVGPPQDFAEAPELERAVNA